MTDPHDPSSLFSHHEGNGAGEEPPLSPHQIAIYSILSVIIVTFSGLCSGLTVGLFSLDTSRLQVMTRAGNTPWKRNSARRLLFFVSNGHWTLVTLLVSNASAMSALPLVLDRLVSPSLAIVLSITAVLFFGEVVPQALFVRHGFAVCSFLVPLLWVLLIATAVISYPFAKLLDKILGHQAKLGRDEVEKHVRIVEEVVDSSSSSSSSSDGKNNNNNEQYDYDDDGNKVVVLGNNLVADSSSDDEDEEFLPEEILVMKGALSLSKKTMADIPGVKPDDAFMLSSHSHVDSDIVTKIVMEGHSRVPVYMGQNREHIIGVLLTKSLLALAYTVVQPSSPTSAAHGLVAPKIGDLPLREPWRVQETTNVTDLLTSFKTGKSHFAAVYNKTGSLVKFVTLDDIFTVLLVNESYKKKHRRTNSSTSPYSPKKNHSNSNNNAVQQDFIKNIGALNESSTIVPPTSLSDGTATKKTVGPNNNSFSRTSANDRTPSTSVQASPLLKKSESKERVHQGGAPVRGSKANNNRKNNNTSSGKDEDEKRATLVASTFAAIRASNVQ